MPPKKKDDKKEEEVALKEEVGVFCFADGSKYDGQIVRKGDPVTSTLVKRQGNGVFVDTCATYDGQWLDDEMSGDGSLTFESGASYVGGFLHSTFYGKGKYTFPDGSFYEGQWRHNAMHGEGLYVDAKGQRWVGKFYDGQGRNLQLEIA
jgi:hypothetical protein